MQTVKKFCSMEYDDVYRKIKEYAENNKLDIVTLDTMCTKEYCIKYRAIVVFKERGE